MNKSKRHNLNVAANSPAVLKYIPSCTLAVLTLLSLISLPIPFMTHILPAFLVIGIVYFTLWQPRFVPFIVVFCCGLFYDAFQSSLLGTHAMLLVILRLAVSNIREHTGFLQNIVPSWGLFVMIALGYFLVEWLFISSQIRDYTMPSKLLHRDALTIALYPLLHIGFSSIISRIQSRI